MKVFICALALFAGAAYCVDTDLNISEKVFEQEFNKLYGDKASEEKAAAALAAAENQINKENELFKEGKASYWEELNENSDLPKDIFEKEKEGDINLKGRGLGEIDIDESLWYTHPELERLYSSVNRQTVPSSYDSTASGWVTPAKNQMSCGSCAAFAATGAHETCMLKSGARFNGLDLSEQYLMDCGYNANSMNGCNGADTPSYGVFFANTLKGQSVHEADYPYLNINPKLTCPTDKTIYNSGAYVSNAMPDYSCTEDKLKTLVFTYGAATTSIYASDSGFDNYAGGVFDGCTSNSTNHAVLVVGYGTDADTGKDYWLVKNSWGTSWGNNGYIKMRRGTGNCGIGRKCFAAQCSVTSGTPSDPPLVPPPPPIPVSQECDVSSRFGPISGGYSITIGSYKSNVKCLNGVCRPAVAGPSNCCMYMCGKIDCKK